MVKHAMLCIYALQKIPMSAPIESKSKVRVFVETSRQKRNGTEELNKMRFGEKLAVSHYFADHLHVTASFVQVLTAS